MEKFNFYVNNNILTFVGQGETEEDCNNVITNNPKSPGFCLVQYAGKPFLSETQSWAVFADYQQQAELLLKNRLKL